MEVRLSPSLARGTFEGFREHGGGHHGQHRSTWCDAGHDFMVTG